MKGKAFCFMRENTIHLWTTRAAWRKEAGSCLTHQREKRTDLGGGGGLQN